MIKQYIIEAKGDELHDRFGIMSHKTQAGEIFEFYCMERVTVLKKADCTMAKKFLFAVKVLKNNPGLADLQYFFSKGYERRDKINVDIQFGVKEKKNNSYKLINQYKDGVLVRTFNTIREFAEFNGLIYQTAYRYAINGYKMKGYKIETIKEDIK